MRELAALLLLAATPALAQNWEITRSELDGTGIEVVISSPQRVCALHVHPASGGIYWSRGEFCDGVELVRANLDGSSELVIATDHGVDGVAGEYIYWKESPPGSPEELWRSNLIGTRVEMLRTFPTFYASVDVLAVDPVLEKVYYRGNAIDFGGVVQRGNLDGTGDQGFSPVVSDLTIDTDTGRVYAATLGAVPFPVERQIFRADLDGSNRVDLFVFDELSPSPQFVDYGEPWLFWDSGFNRIARASSCADYRSLVQGPTFDDVRYVSVDRVNRKLYWVVRGATVPAVDPLADRPENCEPDAVPATSIVPLVVLFGLLFGRAVSRRARARSRRGAVELP